MERVARGFDTEPIQRGLARIPPRIRERVGPVDFLCGVDPIFVGLHEHEFASIADGYSPGISFRWCAHLSRPHNQASPVRAHRSTTIVVPAPLGKVYGDEGIAGAVIAHEYGHLVDSLTGSGTLWDWGAGIVPVSSYAETNWWEAFAESFEAWLFPELYPDAAEILRDSPVLALFEELAR